MILFFPSESKLCIMSAISVLTITLIAPLAKAMHLRQEQQRSMRAGTASTSRDGVTAGSDLAEGMAPVVAISRLARMDSAKGVIGSRRRFTQSMHSRFTIRSDPYSLRTVLPSGTEVSQRQLDALAIGSATLSMRASSTSMHVPDRRKFNVLMRQAVARVRAPPKVKSAFLEADAQITSSVRLADLAGTEYVGIIGVGTTESNPSEPESLLRVVYDTGSADLWVASDLCTIGACVREKRARYNHSRSMTFRSPALAMNLSTLYGSGELRGSLGLDDVRIGSLVLRNQTLGLVQQESGVAFESLPLDGIIGLGFPSFAAEGTSPVMDTLMEQGTLPVPQFAFYLHRVSSEGGIVLWGGVDKRLYEDPLQWFPVVDPGYWALDLVGLRIGSQKLPLKKDAQVIVDSGTTFFAMPRKVYDIVRGHIGADARCDKLVRKPDIVFSIRDITGDPKEIVVNPDQYMVKGPISDDFCTLGVVPLDPLADEGYLDHLLILGEVFMRHYFTVFRREGLYTGEQARVGFARAKADEDVDAFFAHGSSRA